MTTTITTGVKPCPCLLQFGSRKRFLITISGLLEQFSCHKHCLTHTTVHPSVEDKESGLLREINDNRDLPGDLPGQLTGDNRDLPGDLPGQLTGGRGGRVTITYPVRPSVVQVAEVAHYFQRQSPALTSGLHLNTRTHTHTPVLLLLSELHVLSQQMITAIKVQHLSDHYHHLIIAIISLWLSTALRTTIPLNH